MRIGKHRNPYTPGFGVMPPALSGRAEVTAQIRDQLERIGDKSPVSKAFVLTGPRGTGKTALLAWAQAQSKEFGCRTLSVNGSKGGAGQESEGGGALPSGEVSLNLGFVSAKAALEQIWRSQPRQQPLLVLVDEAHEIDLQVAQTLFNSLQTAARSVPLLAVAAGTPDTFLHLGRARVSFIERAARISIGLLSDADAYEALAQPLEKRGVPFEEDVLRKAAREAQNHPHFLQVWGNHLWDAACCVAEQSGLAPAADTAALEAAQNPARLDCGAIYQGRIREFDRWGVTALMAELALDLNVRAFTRRLAARWNGEDALPRELPTEHLEASAEQLLHHSGFMWDPLLAGKWEFGIPSLSTHTVQAAEAAIRTEINEMGFGPALRAVIRGMGMPGRSRAAVEAMISEGSPEFQRAGVPRFVKFLEKEGILGPDRYCPEELQLHTPRLAARVAGELQQGNA